jgi:hypothetical protein
MSERTLLQRKCDCGGQCGDCKKKESTLQRRATGDTQPATAPPIVHEVLRSSGHPLDTATRGFFEPRFGHDFSKVRVHDDSKSAESAQAVNAQAYTVGRNVVFGRGRYDLKTEEGRKLLAHELTHVAQQSGTTGSWNDLRVGEPGSSDEREADRAAGDVANSRRDVGPTQQAPPLVQRQPLPLATNHRPTCAEKCGPSAPSNTNNCDPSRYTFASAQLTAGLANLSRATALYEDAIATNPATVNTAAVLPKLRQALRDNFGWSEGQAPTDLRTTVLQNLRTAWTTGNGPLWVDCIPGNRSAIMQGTILGQTPNAGVQTVGSEQCLTSNCFSIGASLTATDGPHALLHEVFHRVLSVGASATASVVDLSRDVYRSAGPPFYPGSPSLAVNRPDSYASLVDDLLKGAPQSPLAPNTPAPPGAAPAPAPSGRTPSQAPQGN